MTSSHDTNLQKCVHILCFHHFNLFLVECKKKPIYLKRFSERWDLKHLKRFNVWSCNIFTPTNKYFFNKCLHFQFLFIYEMLFINMRALISYSETKSNIRSLYTSFVSIILISFQWNVKKIVSIKLSRDILMIFIKFLFPFCVYNV